jgi:hypothetical protein
VDPATGTVSRLPHRPGVLAEPGLGVAAALYGLRLRRQALAGHLADVLARAAAVDESTATAIRENLPARDNGFG